MADNLKAHRLRLLDQRPEFHLAAQLFFDREKIRIASVVPLLIPPHKADFRTVNPLPSELVQNIADAVKGHRDLHGRLGVSSLVLHGRGHGFPSLPDTHFQTACGISQFGACFQPFFERHAGFTRQLIVAVFAGHARIVRLRAFQKMIRHRKIVIRRQAPIFETRQNGVAPVFRGGHQREVIRRAGHDRHKSRTGILHAEDRHRHGAARRSLAVLLAEGAVFTVRHDEVALLSRLRRRKIRQDGHGVETRRQLRLRNMHAHDIRRVRFNRQGFLFDPLVGEGVHDLHLRRHDATRARGNGDADCMLLHRFSLLNRFNKKSWGATFTPPRHGTDKINRSAD
ncbi:MAG: hypothetical protein BWX70_01683 [Verrucomicrobia bacterium ADurb.Bin070]|nr:MAG: hypothetical protein BWX70_01683 [Verrucomicrobia bacterium ADurb.Bin070]